MPQEMLARGQPLLLVLLVQQPHQPRSHHLSSISMTQLHLEKESLDGVIAGKTVVQHVDRIKYHVSFQYL
jgi:hypothetical protein